MFDGDKNTTVYFFNTLPILLKSLEGKASRSVKVDSSVSCFGWRSCSAAEEKFFENGIKFGGLAVL